MTRVELGRRAELAVADYLFALGFDVLARNHRLGHLELDLVARKGRLLVVTEVRTRGRGSYLRAFQSVDPRKRARVAAAVERLWRRRSSWMQGVERVRLDAAAVSFVGRKTYVEYAPSAMTR
ncbi:MAG TPA: YraN family protein [Polyangiaceae bacterium]|nr:YraN family protein [Polyangiaceae bacterium]